MKDQSWVDVEKELQDNLAAMIGAHGLAFVLDTLRSAVLQHRDDTDNTTERNLLDLAACNIDGLSSYIQGEEMKVLDQRGGK